MSIHKHKKSTDDSGGSGTYIEFKSDESEAQRTAYRLCSRGGKLRSGLEDIDETFAELAPLLAEVLFEEDPTNLMAWVEVDEDDIEAYREEHLETEEDDD
ncbi:hypothetical protein HYG81_21510 (plasmid) [Natrinema zhouii]|uniref:hypothetical protein n=1 Tax=Natrinema zhouii TaxID=1710539 RepID=UPI001CFFA47C|nr:hypothetical protein [Natrinema zhouii]UHQ98155.1 hypothetical protein HYG81_21510 [Natrinema zhouii]